MGRCLRAFRWFWRTRDGRDVAAAFLNEATGISDDGLTIAGWGTNWNNGGGAEAWIATIPEPATLLLLGLGGLLVRRRKGA